MTRYALDANGNTTTKTDSSGTTNYVWDYDNRLTSVTLPGSGGTVSYRYDPMGRRIFKSSSSGTGIYAYDGYDLVEEANATGGAVARYTQTQEIDEPLAMLRGGATSYYQTDGLGSVTSLSNVAGALEQTYTFDSFGNTTASSGSLTNPFQYASRELDSEAMVYFMRARYFDPKTGRFLSEDPAGFSAGPDFYSYVFNNPSNLVDPTGLSPCPCEKNNCIPRNSIPLDIRLELALMKQASKLSGVTYYFGLQGSYARTKFGFGYSFGGSIGMATDPQGNEAMILSPGGGATLGTPGLSGGIQIGAATYSDVSGFCSYSFGGEASGGLGLNVGGGYNTNSSGVFTYANVSIALGKNFDVSPKTVSYGLKVKPICKQ